MEVDTLISPVFVFCSEPQWHCTGKKKAYAALLQRRTFLCRKKWGPQRKDFGGRYGFPGFYRVFVSTTGLESFSFRPEKFPKRFSFGGGRVRFLLLCCIVRFGYGFGSCDASSSRNVKNANPAKQRLVLSPQFFTRRKTT